MRAMLKPLIGHRGPEFKELFNKLLGKTKRVFETKGDMFILTSSGTGATEAALQNITEDGDKIIVNVNGFFSERLGEATREFEASHSTLLGTIGSVIDALAQMGI